MLIPRGSLKAILVLKLTNDLYLSNAYVIAVNCGVVQGKGNSKKWILPQDSINRQFGFCLMCIHLTLLKRVQTLMCSLKVLIERL